MELRSEMKTMGGGDRGIAGAADQQQVDRQSLQFLLEAVKAPARHHSDRRNDMTWALDQALVTAKTFLIEPGARVFDERPQAVYIPRSLGNELCRYAAECFR